MNTPRTFDEAELLQEIPHLRRYARSLTRSLHDSDDLTQTTLERALARRSQYQPHTEFRRWLFTIMRNAYIDMCRRVQRRGPAVSLDDTAMEPGIDGGQLESVHLRDVNRRLHHLRPEEQTVLQLSVFVGLSHLEIADRMDTAVGTVKSRLSRARQALAQADASSAATAASRLAA